jgi:hypothetical protein
MTFNRGSARPPTDAAAANFVLISLAKLKARVENLLNPKY